MKEDPARLIPCGSVHPRHTTNVLADMEQIVSLGIRLIKIHPPHQLLYPNDYINGVKELEIIYRAAEANGIPIMVHTGTSIFPGARNKYGDPMYVDDVAVDFPKLKILLAHGDLGTGQFFLRIEIVADSLPAGFGPAELAAAFEPVARATSTWTGT